MSSEGHGSDDSRVAVPAPVEVVISFGFSPDLVSTTYRQLLTSAEFSGAAAAVWPRSDVATARLRLIVTGPRQRLSLIHI